ncbi:MAG: GGDEF domain-containing protein [Planctomycetota bacterium]|nr:MAG: GGDEF domain-containing protein [Planctomycetota bacterium]
MKQVNNELNEKLSIGNSQTEIFDFLLATEVSSVHDSFHGCVVQICPVMPQSEMFRMLKQRTVIGRELACDIVLNDNAVSRRHAAIDLSDMNYFVTDLGSRNGTFVDDKLLQERRSLKGGEQIRLGGTILKFMESVDKEASYHDVVNNLMARDPLTNAFNRSYMTSTLEKLLASLPFSKQNLALIMIDIDHFKKVNDTNGHLVGDEVLRVFSERIRYILRETDALCRVGGEEFVVICEQTVLQDAVRIAERIRLTVSATPLSTQSGPVSVTCSLGVMTLDQANFATVEDLLCGADERLYLAKASGRNCVRSALHQ